MFGMLGVIGFSLTLPATRLAVFDLDPTFVGLGRALVAAALAAITLWIARAPKPVGRQWLRLAAVSLGVVIGFPLFTSWALTIVPASHGAVVVGLLPLSTALFGAWLAAERPTPVFWGSTVAGSMAIAVFSLWSGGGEFHPADIALLAGVVAAGFGYAEGARLSRELGAWQTISWALVLSVPVLIFPVLQSFPPNASAVGWMSYLGFAYVSVVSMFLGFFAWYKGLAMGGIARVGQLQLLQPFLTLAAAGVLLHENISRLQVAVAVVVLICIIVGRRSMASGGVD